MNWADINPEATAQLVGALRGDGHTIFSEKFFKRYLHSNEIDSVVLPLVKTHASDYRHPKLTIYKEGYPVEAIEGVHALDLLYNIAADLDLDNIIHTASTKVGRGYQAAELTEGILKFLP